MQEEEEDKVEEHEDEEEEDEEEENKAEEEEDDEGDKVAKPELPQTPSTNKMYDICYLWAVLLGLCLTCVCM